MNHSWENNICKRCECIRRYIQGQVFYDRSDIHFRIGERPDCIDWELENSKTID